MADSDVAELMSVAEAAALLDAEPVSPRVERVPLAQVPGRRLAEEVRAEGEVPAFASSQMDGWALLAGQEAGIFSVAGELSAGRPWEGQPLRAGEAVKIMTGAMLPEGEGGAAVGIVPVERSAPAGDGRVRLDEPVEAGRYVRPRGSEAQPGQLLLAAGTMLGPQHVGVLASSGRDPAAVYARPRCVVLSTGDEVVPAHATPGPAQVRNSNTPQLLALLSRLGCDALDVGHVADDREALLRRLAALLAAPIDAVFITGGMSMGDRDYVPEALEELDVELKIRKVRIKPGKPFVFGIHHRPAGFIAGSEGLRGSERRTLVFGLPGNPVSAYVCTVVLASRVLTRMGGTEAGEWDRRLVRLPLAAKLPANGPRQFYQPATLEDGRVRPLGWRGSGDVLTLSQAACLIERLPEAPAIEAGENVAILPLP